MQALQFWGMKKTMKDVEVYVYILLTKCIIKEKKSNYESTDYKVVFGFIAF